MNRQVNKISLAVAMIFTGFGMQAQASEYEITVRGNVIVSDGTPTNDMPAVGVSLHRKLKDDWYLGFNLDISPEFDFEETPEVVDIDSVGVVDAIGTSTMLTLVAERRYTAESGGIAWFWNAGGGINEVDMDDVDGDVEGGGTFDIETDAGTEFVLLGNIGMMQPLGDTWRARYTLTMEHHFADWELKDKVSGNTGTVGDYTTVGFRVGLNYQF